MRLVVARCRLDYVGRLAAHLPSAVRLLLLKADGSVSVHADDRAYKPLNWMSPPCTFSDDAVDPVSAGAGSEVAAVWRWTGRSGETLVAVLEEVLHDSTHELGVDPGLVKDGVEAHLQELLAASTSVLGDDLVLVRREYPTDIGPVDLLCRSADGGTVAVEVKRHAEVDGVEQLTRYLDRLGRDPHLRPVRGVLAAQSIRPQARVLAEDRGIRCLVLDYDELRGLAPAEATLF